jgi:MoxR-like ATPase
MKRERQKIFDEQELKEIQEVVDLAGQAVRSGYVGPDKTFRLLLTIILARGHILLEGVPGIAKTTLAKVFAQVLGCSFRRIQFTPDLLPSDITGTFVYNIRVNDFEVRKGPIFSNIILGDEINRAPSKTQAALLESMQEGQVTIEGVTYPLPTPFCVLATQNPIEQEGVYLLPEAELDRFMIRLKLSYPSFAEEEEILKRPVRGDVSFVSSLDRQRILQLQGMVERVFIEDELISYIITLVRFTRQHQACRLGASPRAALALKTATQAYALLAGRDYVLPDDIKDLAIHVLNHRLLLTPEAELQGLTAEDILVDALKNVDFRKEAHEGRK